MTDRLVFGSPKANEIRRRSRRRQEAHPEPESSAPKERFPMTDQEKYAARCLARCTFLPGSYNKRFARAMEALAEDEDAGLTKRQRTNLWRLIYRYRRQIADDRLVAEAQQRMQAMQSIEEQ